jgi:predicted nucleic acid-binding protein
MSREVFVDTSAWIALSDAGDKYHHRAAEAYQRLMREHRTFLTTNLVIAEAYIIIRRTGGHTQAIRLLRSLRGSPRLQKIWSDASLESRAEEILEKHADQDFSYTDAVSFAVMQERGIEEAFTFDRHFAAMGFRMPPDEAGSSKL